MMDQMISFAPVPTHLSRFAAHVDAISTALNDAREHLEQCVASLKDDTHSDTDSSDSNRLSGSHEEEDIRTEHPALQAYERLRRELGLALRECERGREKLLDLTRPARDSDSDHHPEDLPALSPDTSDGSDKPDSSSPIDDDLDQIQSVTVVSGPDGPAVLDDATSHLLLNTSSHHLPPPGIEQVFESESGTGVVFARERSKLTREERIQMVRKARESGRGISFSGPIEQEEDHSLSKEKTGPGIEVVQELKDVIWKVGERRRKMADEGEPEGGG